MRGSRAKWCFNPVKASLLNNKYFRPLLALKDARATAMKFTAVPQQLATSCCAEVSLAGCSLVWYCQKRSIVEGDSGIAERVRAKLCPTNCPRPNHSGNFKGGPRVRDSKKISGPKSLQFQSRVSSLLHFCTSSCLQVCRCRRTNNMFVQVCICIVDHVCIIVYPYRPYL